MEKLSLVKLVVTDHGPPESFDLLQATSSNLEIEITRLHFGGKSRTLELKAEDRTLKITGGQDGHYIVGSDQPCGWRNAAPRKYKLGHKELLVSGQLSNYPFSACLDRDTTLIVAHEFMESYGELSPICRWDNAPEDPAIRLEYKLDHHHAKLPFRKRTTDAGYDIYAINWTMIMPGEAANIETGIRISPPPGWYITIEGRSSLFREGIIPLRGIIDATYTGPILVPLYNSSQKTFNIEPGDRIAQMTLHKIRHLDFVKVDKFSPEYSTRGDQGWGSSGRNG